VRKRVKISRRKAVDEPEIIVIPMIDVMMFLLFFFMVASLAMVVQSGLAVNLPKASSGSQHSTQNITITIMQNNQIYLNMKPIPLSGIADGLKALHVSPDNLVIINADKNVTLGLGVSVVNEVAKVGVTHYTFATKGE
jgi:biopolymer transport protein ExbD